MAGAAARKANEVGGRRTATINLRLSEREKGLIDAAATSLGKTRTEFVLDSVRQQAVDVLLDRRLFELNDDEWQAVTQALENPPLPNRKLRQLMAKKSPWEA